MFPQRPSSIAVFSSLLASVAIALAATGVLLANLGVLPPLSGFYTFGLGLLLALLGLGFGALGLRATRHGRPGRPRAWFAVATGAAFVAIVLASALPSRDAPRINDITTDPDDPPVFEAAADAGPNRARDMAYPADFAAAQRAAYPDLAPIRLDVPPADAFARARGAAESLGWEITAADPERGVLEAEQRSRLFRFVDDVVVRVRPADGGSVVDVRSKSRDGRGDLGVNARRIRAFRTALVGGAAAR